MPNHARERAWTARTHSDRILSGPRPATMRQQLAALSGRDGLDGAPDQYGTGGPVQELEERVALLLGTEAAVLFPTGVMAQQVALRYGADLLRRDTVGLHPLGHLEVHEHQAHTQLSGLRSVWPTTERRNPTAAEVAALGERISTLLIELPLRDAGFVLPTWQELVDVVGAARAAGARVHFDGARLWESTPYLGRGLAEIAGLADSVYVSFYKTLGGISGAVLAGTADLARYARVWQRRYGGSIFQQWPVAVAALAGLERELPRVAEYVAHARTVAEALAGLPGARVFPAPPHTHQFQLWLPHPAEALNEAALAQAEEEKVFFVGGWRETAIPGTAMAEVTVAEPALGWSAEDVAEVGARFLGRVATVATNGAITVTVTES